MMLYVIYSHTYGVRARIPLILQSIFVLLSFFFSCLESLALKSMGLLKNQWFCLRNHEFEYNMTLYDIYSHTYGVRARMPLILQSIFVLLLSSSSSSSSSSPSSSSFFSAYSSSSFFFFLLSSPAIKCLSLLYMEYIIFTI